MANNPDSDFNLKCQIIEEVRQRPILFNKGHPMYFIRNAKNDEFTNIGLALGITGKYQLESHCINMIKCLENSFSSSTKWTKCKVAKCRFSIVPSR